MKKSIPVIAAGTCLSLLLFFVPKEPAISNNSGAPAGNTGSPTDGFTCARSSCHIGSAVTPLAGLITSNVPVAGYTPGQTYTITATVGQTGITKYGFEISPQSTTGQLRGTLAITSPTTTKIVNTKYVTHTASGTSAPTATKTWSFNWTAPVAGTGAVTFYGAFNYANGNNSSSGDQIKTSTLVIPEDLTSGIDDPVAGTGGLWASPNPTSGIFTLQAHLTAGDYTTIGLYGLDGRIIATLFQGTAAMDFTAIPCAFPSDAAPGIYFIRLQSHTTEQTIRILRF